LLALGGSAIGMLRRRRTLCLAHRR
jgi:hypothetical protein